MMHPKLALVLGFGALLALGNLGLRQREGRVLDDGYHHLGNDTQADWKEASPKPEGKRLDVTFESAANPGEWTLFLEQRSIDNLWRVKLNEVEFAQLKPFPGLTKRNYTIPAGMVKSGTNVLSFVPDVPNDDVVIGKLRLVEQSLREMYDTQVVSLSVEQHGDGAPLPARVTFVDAAGKLAPIFYAETLHTAVRDGVIYISNQAVRLELPRGKYTSYATRGSEWSLSQVEIDVGSTAANVVAHRLRREVDTGGYIAADTHLHTLEFSGHGDASAAERQVTLAGEGVEFAVATDHNHNIDYRPFQTRAGLSSYFTAVVGNEVTTEVGHFNGFPLDPKDAIPAHKLTDFVAIVDGIRGKGAKVVILNHPRWPKHEDSPFANNQLDRDTGRFGSGLLLTVDATELINSTTDEADPLFLFTDWFALLNDGRRIFAVGTSDTHTVGEPAGQGRTYAVSKTDDPAKIEVNAVCEAIKNGNSSIGMGIFATVLVNGTARMGDTLNVSQSRFDDGVSLHVEVRVQAPSWIVPRKLTCYVNGHAMAARSITTVPGAPTDQRIALEIPRECPHDLWLVCVVTGDPASAPYWPNPNPYTLAATNPVFVTFQDGPWQSPREIAARTLESSGGNVVLLGSMIKSMDEAIAVQLLDLYAVNLRGTGTAQEEIRRLVLEVAAGANPNFEGVRRLVARL